MSGCFITSYLTSRYSFRYSARPLFPPKFMMHYIMFVIQRKISAVAAILSRLYSTIDFQVQRHSFKPWTGNSHFIIGQGSLNVVNFISVIMKVLLTKTSSGESSRDNEGCTIMSCIKMASVQHGNSNLKY